MSHEQVVERLREEDCSIAMMASVMLTDAPVTYRTLIGNDHTLVIRSAQVCSYSHWLFLVFFVTDVSWSLPPQVPNSRIRSFHALHRFRKEQRPKISKQES